MPTVGSVYLRDASGHTAALDTSGFLYVNVNGTLSVGSVNISGQVVNVSGQGIGYMINNYSGVAAMMSGLQVVTTVNTTTNISGNVVALSSGTNLVQIASGYNQVTISGAPVMWSGLVVGVSGQTVSVASGIVPNISGQVVNVSGSTISVASGVWFASGLTVLISGQPVTTTVTISSVNVSGVVYVVSGFTTINPASTANLSGQNVVLSGMAAPATLSGTAIGVSGQTVSVASGMWFASGITVLISGQPVTVAVTTNISGNVVYFTSGFNLTQIASGYNQVTISGFAAMSGTPLGVSGQTVSIASGSSQLVSGGGVVVQSGIWLASGIMPNISGQKVGISGQSVVPWLGAPTMASGFGFSGLGIPVATAMYDFSGQSWVPLSASVSGANNNLQVAPAPPTKLFIGFSGTCVQSGMTSNSGGDPMVGLSGTQTSVPVYQVTIRNLSGNNTVYVGGSGARPFSGKGFPLYGGDGLTQGVVDASLIYLFAATSGQFIQWIGSQY